MNTFRTTKEIYSVRSEPSLLFHVLRSSTVLNVNIKTRPQRGDNVPSPSY